VNAALTAVLGVAAVSLAVAVAAVALGALSRYGRRVQRRPRFRG